eukprot:TRINITY_DN2231_c0_g1_i3.p1 TRINITY_DN2231_c0_g1~~TRINITY_DN2231_c0_g1_i3.p1  ORF type:complete len:509 (-),score=180.07 TRINITY_DN2231_c0_g1_i3:426-1952(-)
MSGLLNKLRGKTAKPEPEVMDTASDTATSAEVVKAEATEVKTEVKTELTEVMKEETADVKPEPDADAQKDDANINLKKEALVNGIDLVFAVDCTGSMGSYISEAQRNVQSIVESLVAAEKCDVRFGLVKYRDHPPQESTFVSEQCDFTSAVGAMRANVNTMSAAGGGDGPEAVCCGLHAALHMAWRPDAVKIVVLIADAPPHGLGEHGDGFPNGCPEGRDPLAIARAMLEAGITVYTVGCEPALGSYRFARDFMVAVADITQGQAIALSSAKLLVDVILGGAREELDLERLMGNIDEEVSEARQQVAAERVSAGLAPEVEETSAEYEQYEVQLSSRVARNMAGKGIKARRVAHDGAMAAPQAAKMAKSAGLDRWRTEVVASEPAPAPATLCAGAAAACCNGDGGGVLRDAIHGARAVRDAVRRSCAGRLRRRLRSRAERCWRQRRRRRLQHGRQQGHHGGRRRVLRAGVAHDEEERCQEHRRQEGVAVLSINAQQHRSTAIEDGRAAT